MSYENARNGIGKVFTAEVLNIIVAVCTLITGIFLVLAIGAASAESTGGAIASGIGGVLFSVAAGVIGIIAFILQLVGLNKAGQDSEQIKKAFTITIVGLIVAILFGILNSAFPSATWIKGIGDVVGAILGLLVTYNILFGCAGLKSELTDKANSTWKMYMIVIILDIVIGIVSVILGALGITTVSAVAYAIVLIADFIFDIVAYIMFLSFLNNARKVL